MHKEQTAQESELPDREIGVVHRGHAFLTDDAHANLAGFDHCHVIRAVADGQAARDRDVLLDEIEHLGLLIFTRSARDDRSCAIANLRQSILAEGRTVFYRRLVEHKAELLAAR